MYIESIKILLYRPRIQKSIKKAGFEPQLRTQEYEERELPKNMEQQVINY